MTATNEATLPLQRRKRVDTYANDVLKARRASTRDADCATRIRAERHCSTIVPRDAFTPNTDPETTDNTYECAPHILLSPEETDAGAR